MCAGNTNNKKAGTAKYKVSFVTLGCKVNQAESEALAQLFVNKGYEVVEESQNPDVIVINTCTVTGTGSSKSRKLIRRMVKEHPSSIIAVMGCYTQINPDEAASIEGVDIILGTRERASLPEYLEKVREKKAAGNKRKRNLNEETDDNRVEGPLCAVRQFDQDIEYEELPLVERESRARAMLKIQDGCSQFCSYCIIPYARGPSRSRRPEKVLEEARKLLETGYKELVLTGIHIGAYGSDLKGEDRYSLARLISELAGLPGLARLRLGSIEPMEFTPELLDIAASYPTICPHFHIPLQSGCNSVLQRMNRPYTTEDYAGLLDRIRERVPEAAVAADIMAGFPGETEEEHRAALRFIERCEFAAVHAFPYSHRPGTPAAEMPGQVPGRVKARRVKEIIELGKQSRKRYIGRFVGRPLEVLIERIDSEGNAQGHTRNYIEIKLPRELNPGNWKTGDLVDFILKEEYVVS